ncbi:MAG TPA: hypothetical protein VND64_26565 [Pirellulales bacterium]|nr:hypothetical protein [Pirellulales bacterium]
MSKSDIARQYLARHPKASVMEIVTALKPYKVSEAVAAKIKYTEGAAKPGPKAAKKASTNGSAGTKSDAIREVAKGMTKPVRPMNVRAALSAKGIEVSYTQVGQVLTSMGMKRKRRRRKAAVGAAPVATSNGLNINDLVMAKKLVGQVGSIEKVREALAALARLS